MSQFTMTNQTKSQQFPYKNDDNEPVTPLYSTISDIMTPAPIPQRRKARATSSSTGELSVRNSQKPGAFGGDDTRPVSPVCPSATLGDREERRGGGGVFQILAHYDQS